MTQFSTGQKIRFTGYTVLEPGQEEVLVVGQSYNIVGVDADGGIRVADNDGNGDTVFAEEVELIATKASKTAAAKKSKVASAKTSAKVKAAPKAKAPAKTKAKAKSVAVDGGTNVVPITSQIAQALSSIIVDSETVTKLLESNDMLTAAKELAVSAEQTFISLGGVLSHIDSTEAHKTLGYNGKSGFGVYMQKELNINYRKGMYLIKIYNVTRQFDLEEEKVARIGWSKMKEIASLITADNAEDLLDYADDHTREELVAHVRTSYVRADSEDQNTKVLKTRLTFSLFGDQTETVQRALAAARQAMGDNATVEQALVLITSEWSQLTEAVEFSLAASIKTLELRHGIVLAVVEKGDTNNEMTIDQIAAELEAV